MPWSEIPEAPPATPDGARVNWRPWVVDEIRMTTPFWFRIAVPDPPPAMHYTAITAGATKKPARGLSAVVVMILSGCG